VAFDTAFKVGFAAGFAVGFAAGFAAGFAVGFAAGFARGFAAGFAAGFARGFAAGFATGFDGLLTVVVDRAGAVVLVFAGTGPDISREFVRDLLEAAVFEGFTFVVFDVLSLSTRAVARFEIASVGTVAFAAGRFAART